MRIEFAICEIVVRLVCVVCVCDLSCWNIYALCVYITSIRSVVVVRSARLRIVFTCHVTAVCTLGFGAKPPLPPVFGPLTRGGGFARIVAPEFAISIF